MESTSKRAHWEPIIESWKQSGKSQVSFCKENEISHFTFGYWKKILAPSNNLFVPVKVREPKRNESIFYKIETSLGINIIIPTGADPEDLTVIFKSLGLTT
jgi:hypothetical protein